MAESVSNRIEREMFFRTFSRAARPPEAVIQQFIESLVEQQAPRGAVLFRAGDPSEYIHYIVNGQIELRDPTGLTAPWTFGSRSVVGGIDALQGKPYSRTAVAAEESLYLRMRFDDYFEILEDNFEFTKGMIGMFFVGLEELGRSLPADQVYPPVGLRADPASRTHRGPGSGVARLGLVDRVLVLRSSAQLRHIRLQVLVRLAQEATERRLVTGEALFEPGEGTNELWFVAAGGVLAERADPPFATRFAAGSMVLPIAAFARREVDYRALATEPSLLLGLAREELWDVMEDHADVTRALLAYGAGERARLQTQSIELGQAAAR
jgi:CRP-like cAMP-binding protein